MTLLFAISTAIFIISSLIIFIFSWKITEKTQDILRIVTLVSAVMMIVSVFIFPFIQVFFFNRG